MLAPPRRIAAPSLPRPGTWVGAGTLRMDQQRGRPVLVDVWDASVPQSVRGLDYLRDWHERFGGARPDGRPGLRTIGIHLPVTGLVADEAAVAAACARLDVGWPVLVDADGAASAEYEVRGVPARYLFDELGWLHAFHHGDGGFADLEHEIQALLGRDEPLTPLVRPEDDDDAPIVVPTPGHDGPHAGPYVAGEVWASLAPPSDGGDGEVLVDGVSLAVPHPGAYRLRRHAVSTAGEIVIEPVGGTVCASTTFVAGLAPG